jgi:protein SCO1/2
MLALLLIGGPTCGSAAPAPTAGLLAGFVDDLGQPVSNQPSTQPLRLVVFGYTSCPDVCPLTLLAVHQALEKLAAEAAQVEPLFVTVDPDRDSVQQLHQYVSSFDPRIRALRGTDAALRTLTRRLHVQYWRESLYPNSKDYAMSHTATLFLLGPNQQVVARIPHSDQAGMLADAIVRAVRRAGSVRHGSGSAARSHRPELSALSAALAASVPSPARNRAAR